LTAKDQLRGCEVCAYWNAIAGQFSSVSYIYLSVFIFCHKKLVDKIGTPEECFLWTRLIEILLKMHVGIICFKDMLKLKEFFLS